VLLVFGDYLLLDFGRQCHSRIDTLRLTLIFLFLYCNSIPQQISAPATVLPTGLPDAQTRVGVGFILAWPPNDFAGKSIRARSRKGR
jgi:hypothetical protein